MHTLENKVALVTGASRGLGPYIAERLGNAGCKVVLAARNTAALDDQASLLRRRGIEAMALTLDITQPTRAEAAIKTVVSTFGGLHILVNNAGVDHLSPFESQPFEEIEAVIDLNVTGALRLARLVAPVMLAQGEGHIVNLASVAGLGGVPFGVAYATSKAALMAMSNSLRLELRERGLSASFIAPGFVRGAGMYESQREVTGGLEGNRLVGYTTPEDVARAVEEVIRADVSERIVNSMPLRFTAALARLFPRFGLWLVNRLSRDFLAASALARRSR